MTIAIRRADGGDLDLATVATIVNITSPESPTSAAEQHWSDETYPGTVRLIAEVDRRPVGAATVGRIYMYPADHGVVALLTGNDEANASMRAVNARLDYRPQPDEVTLRGSVTEAMMER